MNVLASALREIVLIPDAKKPRRSFAGFNGQEVIKVHRTPFWIGTPIPVFDYTQLHSQHYFPSLYKEILHLAPQHKQDIATFTTKLIKEFMEKQVEPDSRIVVNTLFSVLSSFAELSGYPLRQLDNGQRVTPEQLVNNPRSIVGSEANGTIRNIGILGEYSTPELFWLYANHIRVGLASSFLATDAVKGIDSRNKNAGSIIFQAAELGF